MNFELKRIEVNEFISNEKPRKIKLRDISFSNVFKKWSDFGMTYSDNTTFSQYDNSLDMNYDIGANTQIPTTINIDETETKKIENEVTKLPIGVASLSDKISMVDTQWGNVKSIKRRALALTKSMYDTMSSKVKFNADDNIEAESNIDINEEEIKQAVKDAFEQINFNKSDVEKEAVISPEEVNDAVTDNYIDPTDTVPSEKESFEYNKTFDNISANEPIFKFEDINVDKIDNSNYDFPSFDIDNQKTEFTSEPVQFNNIDTSSAELQGLLEIVEKLNDQAKEQEKKTQDAHRLAEEKQAEKEKVIADFEAYKSSIKDELNRRRKEEEEALEQARKDEEFTNALVNAMNNSAVLSR